MQSAKEFAAAAAQMGQPETTFRTPAPDCPACQQKTRHTPEEWREHHPQAGSGGKAEPAKVTKAGA